MPTFKEGDRVRVVAREQTDEDAKSQAYFPHYAGMTGTVQKVYGKQEVAVDVDPESLTKEVRQRHDDVRNQMKTKWLDGLSEEGRNKLTEREKDFHLRYMILVAMSDLEKAGPRAAGSGAAAALAAPTRPAAEPATSRPPAEAAEAAEAAPARRTLADIEAAEEAELLRRAQAKP